MSNPAAIPFTLITLALLAASAGFADPARESTSSHPLPPTPVSPIAQFRDWLDLTEPDRSRALSEKPEAVRTVLMVKLAEYDAMDPAQRELRLRATELQYYLRPLLHIPSDERHQRLSQVPIEFRPLINERLSQWDSIKPETRQELIENAWAIRYFLRLETSTDAEQAALRGELSPERRAQFETGLTRWKTLPSNQRHQITRAFHRFFELPIAEQQRTLESLPESERQQIEATLQAFAELAPAQRQLCLNSFRRFAGLTPGERAEFLRNADRWKEMSPEDRATWRRLVTRLPPLPAGLAIHPLPPSPIPATNP